MRTPIAVGWILLVAALAPASSAQKQTSGPAPQKDPGVVQEGINEKGINRRIGRRKGALSPSALRSRPLDLVIRGAATPPVAATAQPKRVEIPAAPPETLEEDSIRSNPLSFRVLTEPPEPKEKAGNTEDGKGTWKGKEKTERTESRRAAVATRDPAPARVINPYLRADVRAFYGIEPRWSFYQKTAPELTSAPSARTPRAATGSHSDYNSYNPRGRKYR